MFGLSLGKFLVLAAAIGLVLFLFGYAGRLKRQRDELERVRARLRAEQRMAASQPAAAAGNKAEDLMQCARCGSYVVRGTPHRCKG